MKLLSIVATCVVASSLLMAEVEVPQSHTRERLQEGAYGVGKLALMAANLYAAASSAYYDVWQQRNAVTPVSAWLFDWNFKNREARMRIFRELIKISSCSYVAYRCLKSALHSFAIAFEKERVIKRSLVDEDALS